MRESTPERGKSAYRQHMDTFMSAAEKMHAPTVAALLKINRPNMFADFDEYKEWAALAGSFHGSAWSDVKPSGRQGLAEQQALRETERVLARIR